MTNETHESGSQTVESQTEVQDSAVKDALAAFGISAPSQEEKPAEAKPEDDTAIENAPAIEQTEVSKVEKVKFDKHEVEVDISTEEKLHNHLQRSLVLERERERKAEIERNLDRAAKLQGFKDRNEFIANLDRIEQQQQQQQQNEFEQLKSSIIEQLVENGVDENAARQYAENNPLVAKAKEALEADENRRLIELRERFERESNEKWNRLYDTYPELRESSKVFSEGLFPDWYTPEMKARIERGYDPVDAYELSNKDVIRKQAELRAEQRIIKDQMLGRRSQVETVSPPEQEPYVPKEMVYAFSAFGLEPAAAKKYIKK